MAENNLMVVTKTLPKTIQTTNAIAVRLLNISQNHISEINGIERGNLFKTLFGHYPKDEDLGDYLRWDFTRKAMHLLRQKSNCFIVNKYENRDSCFFVVKTDKDATYYIDRLERNIKSMKLMQKKVQKAVTEKWYQQNFCITGNETKKLKGEKQ